MMTIIYKVVNLKMIIMIHKMRTLMIMKMKKMVVIMLVCQILILYKRTAMMGRNMKMRMMKNIIHNKNRQDIYHQINPLLKSLK